MLCNDALLPGEQLGVAMYFNTIVFKLILSDEGLWTSGTI
jgi:hypothetical protein